MGKDRPWHPPAGTAPVFIKETFGPFAAFETQFDPLAELLNAGLPADSVQLVVLLRDPRMVWASWRNLWPQTSTIGLLECTYHACLNCVATALGKGVPVQPLSYEASTMDPPHALGVLFGALGLGAPEPALHDWPNRPGFGEPGSGVVLPDEPDRYITPGGHDRVIRSAGFHQMPPRAEPTSAELAQIARSDILRSHANLAALGGQRE